MCRLFAVHSDRRVSAVPALVSAPHALLRQSCCDLRGECHPSGWGIGYYPDSQSVRVRSTLAAAEDPGYRDAAQAAVSSTIIGHVRQASVGGVSEANTHPFAHGRWLFAHNGTVQGFAEHPDPLRELIPNELRVEIQGETDSEHLFYALLGRIRGEAQTDGAAAAKALGEFLQQVAQRYPGTADEPTRLNVVLTDGRFLLASRWGHTLYLNDLKNPQAAGVEPIGEGGTSVRGVAVASEPITPQGRTELPDRSVVVGRPDGSYTVVEV